MLKEIYIVKGGPSEDYNAFRIRMHSLAGEIEMHLKPATLKLNITLKAPPRISVIPFSRQKAAAFSITGKVPASRSIFSSTAGFTGAYRVEEALPVSYKKAWEDGTPTPGVCMLTLFNRKPGLDDQTFIIRWHQGHTPLSLRLHPLWNYNRNVVTESSTENLVHYEGIVEEQFRQPAELLNPFRFFGPALKTPLHMWQVYRDSRSFIDMKSMEIYLTTEIHLKS
jgi:hypothetical protein